MQELPAHKDHRPLNRNCPEQPPLSNLDHVTDFHRRLSESLNSRSFTAKPLSITPSMSASSYISSFTDGAVRPIFYTELHRSLTICW